MSVCLFVSLSRGVCLPLCLCLQYPSVTGQISTVRQRACFPLNSFTLFHSHVLLHNYTNIYFDFPKKTISLIVQYCFIIDALSIYYIVPSGAPVKGAKCPSYHSSSNRGMYLWQPSTNFRNGFTYYIRLCCNITFSAMLCACMCGAVGA